MSRIRMAVEMELRSDVIFGTGASRPGGEDIDVRRNRDGWPNLGGAAVKGLLRESMENLLSWTGQSGAALKAIFGEADWNGIASGRRIQVTDLTLKNPPENPEDCFGTRAFTKMEDGIIAGGTLRQAVCINRGLCFEGWLYCDAQDEELLQQAVSGIRWVGMMRTRGFGRVHMSCTQTRSAEIHAEAASAGRAPYLHYQLNTLEPLIVTRLNRSYKATFETRDCIPGAAIRGMVLSALSQQDPEWFAAHRQALLHRVRFLDALPRWEGMQAIPTIRGFYENKDGSGFTNVILHPDLPDGLKRARMGAFCALDESKHSIRCWNARTGGGIRIQRGEQGEDSRIFQTQYLEGGQKLDGYVVTEDPELLRKLAPVLSGTVWLGADRYEGFGRCEAQVLPAEEAEPFWQQRYGYGEDCLPGTELYLLALSPVTMLGPWGEPVGIDENALARLLGVESVQVESCSASVNEFGGYNRIRACRDPAVEMYERGSVFHLICSEQPQLQAIRQIQRSGLGIRTAQGCGSVLFLRPQLYRSIDRKEEQKPAQNNELLRKAEIRRKRCEWIQNTCRNSLQSDGRYGQQRVSESQLGTVQALCEKAIAMRGDTRELEENLRHNIEDRGWKEKKIFEELQTLIREVLNQPLPRTLGCDCRDSTVERLELLVELFDHSRKFNHIQKKNQARNRPGGR